MTDNHIHIGQFKDLYYDPFEIAGFLSPMPYTPETVRPFFWYIPDYINQGVSVESAFNNLPYMGIKIHPFVHCWDFENLRQIEALHSIFDYSDRHSLPVLIHTGHSGIDSADRFERFFGAYRNTQFILAHCRPLETTIRMIAKYMNVFCDTAFVPEYDLQKIIEAGYKNRIILGSDFPITHYYNPEITLREHYTKEINEVSNK